MSTPAGPAGTALVVTSLYVHEAPGFPREAGFTLRDLGAGVNILYGRNGAGKSTAARVLLDMLWAIPGPRREVATLTLQREGVDWRLDYDHGRLTAICAGVETVWSWPYGPELRPLPLLTLRDLLTQTGAELAAQVRREMRGGFDPMAAAQAAGAVDRPFAANSKEVKRVQAAREQVQELTTEQTMLAAELRERAQWLAKQQEAKAAQARLVEWQDVEAWRKALAHERAMRAALAAEREAATALLADPEAYRRAREVLRQAKSDLRALDDKLEALARELAAAQAQAADALARMDAAADPQRATLDVPAVDEWDALLADAEQVRAARVLHARAQAVLGAPLDATARAAAAARLDALRAAAEQLQAWLALPLPSVGGARSGAVAAIALAAAGGVLAWLGITPWGWLLLGAGLGIGSAAWWWVRRNDDQHSRDAAARLAADYARRTDVPQPATWTREDVQAAAAQVAAEVAAAQLRYLQADLWVALAAVDPQGEQAALAARLDAVRARLGAAPHLDALALSRLADLLRQWQAAHARAVQLSGEREALAQRRDAVAAAAAAAAATVEVTVAGSDIAALEAAMAAIDARLGRHEADAARVAKAERELRDAEQAATVLRSKLDPNTVARVATQTDEKIAKQRERDAALAADYDTWVKRIQDVDTRERKALTGDVLAAALAEQDQALAELAAKRRDNVRRLLLTHLAAGVLRAGDERFKPALLARAEGMFAEVTQHRYQLLLASDNDVFAVYDHERGRKLSPEELSDGTRVQLLLTLRLANVEQEEARTGLRLPLVLDEVLANSDDERAAALMEAVLTLAGDRQVWVLTAQHDEVDKWQSALARSGAVAGRVVELHPARVLRTTSAPVPAAPVALPPEARLADVAAALAVPQPALDVPAAGAHVGAVLLLCGGDCQEAADVLQQLVALGLHTAGALLQVCERNPAVARTWLRDVVTPEAFAATVRGLDVARKYIAQGRGKPLDYAFIQKVCDVHADAVWEVAEAVGRNAALCLERLQNKAIKRFGPARIAALHKACVEAGYLDTAPKLDRAAVREALAVALAEPLAAGVLGTDVLDRTVALLWPSETM